MGVNVVEGRISKLQKVGSVRLSFNAKTLVVSIVENGIVKTFLIFHDDLTDVCTGLRQNCNIYGGRTYENTIFEEEKTT